MADQPFYSTEDLTEVLGEPLWKVRKAVDKIAKDGGTPIPRIGGRRVIQAGLLEAVRANLPKVIKGPPKKKK